MNEVITLVVVTFIVGASIWRSFGQRVTKESDDVTGDRSFVHGPKALSVVSGALGIISALVGGFMVIGLVEIGFRGGFTGYLLPLGYVVGAPLLVWATRKLETTPPSSEGLILLDGLVRDKFGPVTERLFIVLTILLFTGVLAGQFVSLNAIATSYSGLSYGFVILVCAAIGTAAYSVAHGMKGILANDRIQAPFELGVAVLVPLALFLFLYGRDWRVTPPTSLGGELGAPYPIVGILFLALSMLVRADVWQRLKLVEPRSRPKVVWIVVTVLLAYYFLMTSVGNVVAGNATLFPFLKGVPPSSLMPALVANLVQAPAVGGVFQGLCLAGIIIALLSTIDSYLGLVGVMLGSLVTGLGQESSDDESRRVRVANARAGIVVAFLGSVFTALMVPNLVDLISASFGLIAVLAPCVGVALTSKKALPDRAGWIPLLVSVVVLLSMLPILKKAAFVPAAVIGILVAIPTFYVALRKGK